MGCFIFTVTRYLLNLILMFYKNVQGLGLGLGLWLAVGVRVSVRVYG